MTILLVEDERSISIPLQEYLQRESYKVVIAESIEDAKKAFHTGFKAVILDWRLPDGEGVHLIPHFHKTCPDIPVIMLTAKAELVDKIVGLEMGSTDYITKPFAPRELLARLKNHIRIRGSNHKNSDTSHSVSFQINEKRRQVSFKGQVLKLSKLEYQLLSFFVKNSDQVFSREELLDKVWGMENFPTTRTVDNHVLQLRQKSDPNLFKTVHGAGYMFSEHIDE